MGDRATRRKAGARLLLLALLAGVVVLALAVAAPGAFAFPVWTQSQGTTGPCGACHTSANTHPPAQAAHTGLACGSCHGTPFNAVPTPAACGSCHGTQVFEAAQTGGAAHIAEGCTGTCHTAIVAPATITSITPTSAEAGASVTITGSGFGATQGTGTVMFGTTTATVTAWSATSITATVPASLAPGAVMVTVTPQGGTASVGFSFTVAEPGADTTPPVTTLTGAVNNRCYNRSLNITLSATDAGGVASITYAINGGTPVVVMAATADVTLTVDRTGHTTDGTHVITYFATDVADNVEATRTLRVRIDTVKPATRALNTARAHQYEFTNLRYRIVDSAPTCGRANVTIRIRRGATLVRTLRLGVKPVNRTLSARVRANLPPGSYRYYVYARDLAGNAQANVASNRLIILPAFGGGSW
jgi:hypothetical protein